MARLLAEGKRVPVFCLRDLQGRDVRLETFLRRRRVVLLFLSSEPEKGDNERAWLKAARETAHEFKEREMTVLVITRNPENAPDTARLPDPFVVLTDGRGEVTSAFGGAPAFYLIGKDATIKRSLRICPSLPELFGQIDVMPMRRQEMQEGQSGLTQPGAA